MRDIIFRAKRFDNKKWVYGSLVQMLVDGRLANCIAPREEVGRANPNTPKNGIFYTLNEDIFIASPDTIGQFTGVIDVYGTRIFEGDIIRSYGSIGDEIIHCIRWSDKECYFEVMNIYGSNCGSLNQTWVDEFDKEIIGNIFDNPELLKPKNGE